MKALKIVSLFFFYHSWASAAVATFAGGCFWCMEPPFEKLVGVEKVISGYAGGKEKSPRYEDVASGKTGHREAVQVHYNPQLVSYQRLLEVFWMNIDPTDDKGQFVDKGFQYTSAIFTHGPDQERLAKRAKKLLIQQGKFKNIVTKVIPATTFFEAEEYHQDFYKKNPLTIAKYKYYRSASGRDDFIKKHWKKGDRFQWQKQQAKNLSRLEEKLTQLQYAVTQNDETEPPFENRFWNNKKPGIYVDIVTGEALFSSKDKYVSGTGWPSFTKPIEANNIIEVVDKKLFTERVEVRSRMGDSHLGHVFTDGPKPFGLRYCINSAALRFIALEDLEKKGYGNYKNLFL